MEIDLHTRIGALLKAYPELETVLLELSPAFSRLRNPVLRRTVAKAATVKQTAKMAGISPEEMVAILRRKAGLAPESAWPANVPSEERTPEWFDESKVSIRFDAGPIIDAGQSPMQDILSLSQTLTEGEIMELCSPSRPQPIMDILKNKGFRVWFDDGSGSAYFLR